MLMKKTGIILCSLMLLSIPMVQAQETARTVRGRITSATTGKGLVGVNLTSPNLKVSAMTGDDGTYEILLPSLDVPLVVSAPDCKSQIVPVQGRTVVDITMLDELPETDPSELTLHIDGMLRSSHQSGQPGSGDTYFIRGLQSINLSSQPLFIIDGVEWQMGEDAQSLVAGYHGSPLNMLDPDDIERVEVMRDGSAIWGSKGAAGVVVISTKRARDMATKIEANISMGVQMPFRSMPMMNAEAYKRYASDVMRGLKAEEREQLHFIEDDILKSYYWDSHQQTDWLSEVIKPAFLQNYGINVAGGDDIALYRFSLGYGKNNGSIDGTSFGRMNVRFNSDIKLTQRLSLAADIAYAQTMTDAVFDGLDEVHNPVYQALIKSPLYGPWQHNSTGQATIRMNDTDELGVGNPVALTGDNILSIDRYRFNLNLRPSYSFTDRLRLGAILGFSWDKTAEDVFLPDYGVADMPLVNQQKEVYNTALNTVANLMARQSTLSAEGRLDWSALDTYSHDLRLAAGGRFYNTYYKWNSGLGYNTGSDFMRALSNTNSYLRWIEGDNYKERNAAWFITTDYSYLNKYFLNLGLELSTSSRYGLDAGGLKMAGVSWAFNPSLSAAWLVSSERWMSGLSAINEARLHVALSQTGNDRLPLFANHTYQQIASSLQDVQGPYLNNLGNEGLKWETTRRASVGLDLSMLHNRWQLSADLFWARTSNLVTRKRLNDIAGMPYYWDNNGELTNRGFEFSTSARIIDSRDWRLILGVMLGHYNNKIQELRNGSFTTDVAGATILTAVGKSAGVFYGWQTNGVLRDAAEAARANLRIVAENGEEVTFKAGDVRFVDQNGDGVIDESDRVVLGNPNPDLYGNFNLQLRWKRLTLDGVFGYSIGGEAYNALRQQLESGSNLWNQTTAMEKRWTADGQETDMPRAAYGDPMGNSRTSDRWVEDASYLKLRRLQLTYDVPLHTSFLQGLSLWATANNLFTFSRYLGTDPEFSMSTSVLYQGVDSGLVPSSRSFQLGVKINL